MISQVLVAAGLLCVQAADSGSSGQNYQQYVDKYAGNYKKYMKQYAGDYQKYQNTQKYMDCDSFGKVRSAKDANTTAQLDEWHKGAQKRVACYVPEDYSANKYASEAVDRQYKRRLAELNKGGSQSSDDYASPLELMGLDTLNLDATATSSQGNYKQYMDKYAGSYKKYMKQYAGDYQKYQNFQKYSNCDSFGKVRSAKDANTTAQLDEWHKGAQKQVTCYVPEDYSANKYASEAVDRQYKRRLAELNNGGSKTSADYASPLELIEQPPAKSSESSDMLNLGATASSSQGNYKQYMDKYAGSYKKYMKQYASDYQKYQNTQKYMDCDSFGKVRSAKDANTTAQLDEWHKGAQKRVACYVPEDYSANKYASEEVDRQYKNRLAELNKGGSQSSDDYASPLELMGLDTLNLGATANNSQGYYKQYMDEYAGSYKKYVKQYAGDYQKYQNFQKYRDCDSFGKVHSARDANTTAQLDEWHKGAQKQVTCYVPEDYSANKYASEAVDRQYKRRLAELNKDGTSTLATQDSSPFEAAHAMELMEKTQTAAKTFLANSADQVKSDPMIVVGACSLAAAFAFFVFFAARHQRSVQFPVAQLG